MSSWRGAGQAGRPWQTLARPLFPSIPSGQFCWKGPLSPPCSWCLTQEDPELDCNPRCDCNMHRNKSVARISVSLFCLRTTGIFQQRPEAADTIISVHCSHPSHI